MDKLYTLKETLEILKVSRMTLYRIMDAGGLKPLKIGGKLKFTEKSIQKFIDSFKK